MIARSLVTIAVSVSLLALMTGCGQTPEPPKVTAEFRSREQTEVRPPVSPPDIAPQVAQPQPEPQQTPPLPPRDIPELALPQVRTPGQDPFAVPDGTPDEIFRFIESLQFAKPAALDEKSIEEFRWKLARAVLTAADKVLAQANVATAEQMQMAVQLKMLALSMLSELGDAEAPKLLEALPAELEAAGRPDLAKTARGFVIIQQLEQSGEMTDAEVGQLADRVQKYLESGEITQADAQIALIICQILESRQLNDLLAGFHDAVAKKLASSEDEMVRQLGKMVDGMSRRANLVGKPMEVSGVTVSGEPLDWQAYQGKVVLVTFWATWCAPCRREIPALLQAYQNYHDQGFDIVAISVDDNRQDLDQFLQTNPLPWTVVFDREAPGERMAQKYGVMAIPQMILVGRDGNVVATNVRGHNLPEYLEKLIGPAGEVSAQEMTVPAIP